jgi:hypothetical protein
VEVEELEGDEDKHAEEAGRDDEVVARVQVAKEQVEAEDG